MELLNFLMQHQKQILKIFEQMLTNTKNIYLKRINFSRVLILVTCLVTKISTVQKLVRTKIANTKSGFKSKKSFLRHDQYL